MAFRLPRRVQRAATRAERAAALAVLSLPPRVLRKIAGPPQRTEEGYEMDLEMQVLVRLIELMRMPPMHAGGVARARKTMDRSAPTLDFEPRLGVAARNTTVAGAAGPLRARVYTPSWARGAGAAPGLVYFHGGGFVVGSLDSHDGVCRAIADEAGVVLVAVDYRLAPEHPFPAAAEDAIAATRAILADAGPFGIDPARVAVCGDSAGGNLSAVVAQALRDDPRRPVFQVLVYPATDMTRSMRSHSQFRESFFLSRAATDWYLEHYMGKSGAERDPRASPLFASDLSRLPPALVITAGFDPLRDEGRAYAEKMAAAGVPVEHVCAEGMAHGFLNLGAAMTEAARIVHLLAARVRTGVAKKVADPAVVYV
jgi:acetyl esterase